MSDLQLEKLRQRIGDKIRTLRKAKQMTQSDFAAQCGVSHKYLGEIERGEKTISVEVLERIAQAQGLKNQLLEDSRPSRDLMRHYLLQYLDRADQEQMERLYRLVRAIDAD